MRVYYNVRCKSNAKLEIKNSMEQSSIQVQHYLIIIILLFITLVRNWGEIILHFIQIFFFNIIISVNLIMKNHHFRMVLSNWTAWIQIFLYFIIRSRYLHKDMSIASWSFGFWWSKPLNGNPSPNSVQNSSHYIHPGQRNLTSLMKHIFLMA